MRRIPFPMSVCQEMITPILAGRLSTLIAPVWPQPTEQNFSAFIQSGGRDHARFWSPSPSGTEATVTDVRVPVLVGGTYWVPEVFALERRFDGCRPWAAGDTEDGVWYQADRSSVRPINAKPGRWRSGRGMPAWASRLRVQISGVRVARLLALSTTEVCALRGLAVSESVAESSIIATLRDDFFAWWDRRYGGQSIPHRSDPWVWLVDFKIGD